MTMVTVLTLAAVVAGVVLAWWASFRAGRWTGSTFMSAAWVAYAVALLSMPSTSNIVRYVGASGLGLSAVTMVDAVRSIVARQHEVSVQESVAHARSGS